MLNGKVLGNQTPRYSYLSEIWGQPATSFDMLFKHEWAKLVYL